MKELLKHYLGTGISFNTHYLPESTNLKITAILEGDRIEYYDEDSGYELLNMSDIKPIMRRLSDLDKEITVEGYNDRKPFVPINQFRDIYSTMLREDCINNNGSLDTDALPWDLVNQLIQWHFWIGDQSLFDKEIIDKLKMK